MTHARSQVTVIPIVTASSPAVAWAVLAVQVGLIALLRRPAVTPREAAVISLNPAAGTLGLLFARLAGAPMVCRLQADLPRTRLKRAVCIGVLRSADGVISVSSFTSKIAIAAGVNEQCIRILPPGIDPSFAEQPLYERPLGADFVVAYVGRLEAEKGPEDALRAFALARRPGWRLLIAGRGAQEALLHSQAVELGVSECVEFAGLLTRPELRDLLDGVSVALMPTKVAEGYGRVAIEALLRKVPIIGYESGGLIEACGPGGLLVPVGDVHALAQALSTLANDRQLSSRLSHLGHRHALSEFERMRSNLSSLLEELVCD